MRSSAFLVVLLLAAGAAGEEPSVASLVEHLGDGDGFVRREAARRLVAAGDVATTPVMAARAARDPVRAAAAEEVWRALVLVRRLRAAAPSTPGFWISFEEARELPPEPLREAVLAAAIPDPARRAALDDERRRAKHVVRRFCLEWNEISEAPGSPEEEAREALVAALRQAGPAAAPHVLAILEADPLEAFGRMDPEEGVTARMEVRAVFAAMFLELREALPHLLLLSEGPSLTLTSNAGALFLRFVTGEKSTPFTPAATERIAALWEERRAEHAAGIRRLSRRLVADLLAAVATEVVDPPRGLSADVFPTVQAHLVENLGRLRGETFVFDDEAPLPARREQVREIVRAVDDRDWR